jgi:hypothetical protein
MQLKLPLATVYRFFLFRYQGSMMQTCNFLPVVLLQYIQHV